MSASATPTNNPIISKKLSKTYTNDQVISSLRKRGFSGNGGTWSMDGEELESSDWILHVNNHLTLMAHVEDGKINGIHPVQWFEINKDDIIQYNAE